MRAAIYARYSSELQSANSIEDQLRLCREKSTQVGAEIVREYTDAAISGSHLQNRPGFQRLLADAKAGQFDILIAEALDRLSRDQEDTAGIFKRLVNASVKIVTLSEGEINELHVGLKGTMNALFLKDLASKVRRGQRGRAEAGMAAGGAAYGYCVVKKIGADGELVRGKRVIDPERAEIIRSIFTWFLAGQTPRAIAGRLNLAGIASPRNGKWNASTINGSYQRGNGILHNALYIGRLTYNRQQFRKDPDTGRRLPRVNAAKDWIVTEVPELRIVDQATWDAVQRYKRRNSDRTFVKKSRPKYLLAGLLVCGVCGGPIIKSDRLRLGCSAHKESGTCGNGRKIVLSRLEERVLAGLRDQLVLPEAVGRFVKGVHEQMALRRQDAEAGRRGAEKQLASVEVRISRIVEAIADGTAPRALRQSLAALEVEQDRLEADLRLARGDQNVIELQGDLAARYREQVEKLSEALAEPDDALAASIILRRLVERIVIRPKPERGRFEAEIYGDLARMMPEAIQDTTWVSRMVAAEGFVRWPKFPGGLCG